MHGNTVFTIRSIRGTGTGFIKVGGSCGFPASLVRLTLRRVVGATTGIITSAAGGATIYATGTEYDHLAPCLLAPTVDLTIKFTEAANNGLQVTSICCKPSTAAMAATLGEIKDLNVAMLDEMRKLRKTVSEGFSRILQERVGDKSLARAERSDPGARPSTRKKPRVVRNHTEKRRRS